VRDGTRTARATARRPAPRPCARARQGVRGRTPARAQIVPGRPSFRVAGSPFLMAQLHSGPSAAAPGRFAAPRGL